MKRTVLRLIEAWQVNPDRKRGLCLQSPTCSVYGHRAISRYGLICGGVMTAWRVFTCNGCMRRRVARGATVNTAARRALTEGPVDATGPAGLLDEPVPPDRRGPGDGFLGLGDLLADAAQSPPRPVGLVLVVDDLVAAAARGAGAAGAG